MKARGYGLAVVGLVGLMGLSHGPDGAGIVRASEAGEPDKPPEFYKGELKRKAPEGDFVAAGKEMEKQNFADALILFEKVVAAQKGTELVPASRLGMAWCKTNLAQYDEALAELAVLIDSRPGTLWEARANAKKAEMLAYFPYYCYRTGDTCSYNTEVREGAQEYAWYLLQEEARKARAAARSLYLLYLDNAEKFDDPHSPQGDVRVEALENNRAMATLLTTSGYEIYDDPAKAPEISQVDLSVPFEKVEWGRLKVLYLLDECGKICKGCPLTPLAECRLQKALFLASYPEYPPKEWVDAQQKKGEEWAKSHPQGPPFQGERWKLPQHLDPLRISESILADFSTVKEIDKYYALHGRFLQADGQLVQAVEQFRSFLKKYPDSKYKGDVQYSLDALANPSFSVYLPAVAFAGDKVKPAGSGSARNVKGIDIEYFRIEPDAWIGAEWFLKKGSMDLNQMAYSPEADAFFEGLVGLAKEKPVVQHVAVEDKGDYQLVTVQFELAIDKMGLYVYRVKTPAGYQYGFHVLTDLMMVTRTMPGGTHYYVTDANTGKPLAGVDVVVRETMDRQGLFLNYRDVKVHRLKTNKNGVAEFKFTLGSRIYGNQASAYAVRGGTLTISDYDYPGYYQVPTEQEPIVKGFVYTDRPLYRPGDEVKYRIVVRDQQADGKYTTPSKRSYEVSVSSPDGSMVYKAIVDSDEFGSVHSSFKLPASVGLGAFYISALVVGPDNRYLYLSSGSSFRVEEYKKPEFKVSVTPSAQQASVGDEVTAVVAAEYYFGGPVAGAEVSWSISRSPYYHWYVRPGAYDWLYGEGYGAISERPYYGGNEIVKDGKGVTDEKGQLLVTLPPLKPQEAEAHVDYTYYVVADVVDLSRRTIQGSGSVVVSHNPFFVDFVHPAGYYNTKDKPEVELVARTANDTPVEARGTWLLERLQYEYGKPEPLRTPAGNGGVEFDKRGDAEVKLSFKDPGTYELTIRCRKDQGKEVEARNQFYVVDAKTGRAALQIGQLAFIPDKREYAPGDKARVLVAAPRAGWVLLVAEGGGSILLDKLLEIKETGTVIEIPIGDGFEPNFFLSGVEVAERQVYIAERQIHVPPARKFLDVELKTDKEEYKPGEKGIVEVSVTDSKGKPVQAQVGVWMFDSSVLYVQQETMWDVRQYFHGQIRYTGVTYKHSGYLYLPYRVPQPADPGYQFGGLEYVPDYSWQTMAWGAYQYPVGAGGAYYGNGWGEGDYGAVGMLGSGRADYKVSMDKSVALEERSVARAEAAAPPPAQPASTARTRDSMAGEDIPAAPVIAAREHFPDTILWKPDVVTGTDGKARVDVTFPDSLTTWAARAVAADRADLVGQGSASTVTTKKLIARLEIPRFLVEGDRGKLAAIVRNAGESEMDVDLELTIEGQGLRLLGEDEGELTVGPGRDRRIDFEVEAVGVGEPKVTITVEGGGESDALVQTFPVVEYGSDVTMSRYLVQKGAGKQTAEIPLPDKWKKETASLTVTVNTSLAGMLFSALPYLLDYPYGCVEQTMSRFLPAVMVRQTIKKAGIALSEIKALPQKADLASPIAKPGPWWKAGVFSDEGLDEIVKEGLQRLYNMQGYDGGWGWWGGFESDPYMTAYVVMGLTQAQLAGADVRADVVDRGFYFLQGFAERVEKKNQHLDMYVAYVLSMRQATPPALLDKAMVERGKLSHQGRSLLALALWNSGRKEDAVLVVENIRNQAWIDEETGTASFKLSNNNWWWWWEDRTEAVTWALRAFTAIKPEDPTAGMFARWLAVNREGTHWDSTKTTAMAVVSLVEYMDKTGELKQPGKVTLKVGGKTVKSLEVDAVSSMTLNESIVLAGDELPDGKLKIELEYDGKGTVYTSAFLTYFSKEKTIPAGSSQIAVSRTYFRLTPSQRVEKDPFGGPDRTVRDYERELIKDGADVESGDLVEVKVEIDSPNDYEYLVFEDPKPAGMEAVELKSGSTFENGAWWYREFRDRKVVSFLNRLDQGKQTLTYQLRAGIPGVFHALPHKGYAMYAPRVRASSTSAVVEIR